ncbi:hypothetical protein HYFRA_00003853 [Hymenoscyphus fraxineus]|uniref:Major facilitator superfamily (MFS) profile domain-containing protein n=1 Tax=Hymenoscyphus fraxineus TaxID=746836 RepID=A0A9N9PVA0_9HELO|nr:hypothetical protein HYFRA_00003853 [Hymenoscyphus fraxineus]
MASSNLTTCSVIHGNTEPLRHTRSDDISPPGHNEKHIPGVDEGESLTVSMWKDDPKNPLNWSKMRRWAIITLLVTTNFIAALCTSSFEPALPTIMDDFHSDSKSLASLTISIYVIGYCMGPLIVAPLSELYGHVAVLYPAYIIFSTGLAVCGSSKSLPLFIVFRAVMGFGAITFVLMGPAIIADLIPRERRGFALSIMSTGPVVVMAQYYFEALFLPIQGPVMGGYIVESTSWRWTFWFALIAFGVLFLLTTIILRETYPPVLLRRRKQTMKSCGLITANSDKELGDTRQVLKAAWVRPFKMLFQSPIVPFVGFYTAISNAYGTICFATVGTVFQDNYSFSPGQSGLAYLGLTAGFLLCQFTLGRFSDQYMVKMEKKHNDKKPEYRLPPLFIGAFLLPIGLFWYGWSLERNAHWIIPIIGSSFIAIGIMSGYLPVQMYLVDAFPIYAASANGACTIIRSICATLLPLSANPLYENLGYGWGNSVLAFIALGLVPIAFLVLRYSERIRTSPRFQPKL